MLSQDAKSNVITGKIRTCAIIRCVFHAHDARYRIKWFEKDRLFVIECISCQPPTEIVRCKVAKDEKA